MQLRLAAGYGLVRKPASRGHCCGAWRLKAAAAAWRWRPAWRLPYQKAGCTMAYNVKCNQLQIMKVSISSSNEICNEVTQSSMSMKSKPQLAYQTISWLARRWLAGWLSLAGGGLASASFSYRLAAAAYRQLAGGGLRPASTFVSGRLAKLAGGWRLASQLAAASAAATASA